MKWNDSQQKAIEERGKNIIVSAAAGSGKTAVLVERILRLIIEEKTGVDEILVVTFTKAAAAEMKERIGKAIKKSIKESAENREFLKEQLDFLSQSSISTFHSFAMNLIKNYYYVADISPDLKTADETQVTIMKINAMEQVIQESFENEDNREFIKFMNNYSSHKNEKSIKESLLKTYDRIMAMEEPFEWMSEKIEEVSHYDDSEFVKGQEIYNMVYDYYTGEIAGLIRLKGIIIDILEDNGLTVMAEKQKKDMEQLLIWNETLKGSRDVKKIDSVRAEVAVYKFTQMRATKDEKEIYSDIKDLVGGVRKQASDRLKELKEDFPGETFTDVFISAKETYPYLREIERLLKEFHKKYSQMKLDKNLMDFNDMEHFALEILKNEKVCEECRNRYKYIFVDEYQDSNYIQEAIIGRIKRINNLFVVGDLKQSIYSFRLAEPDIFRQRYRDYTTDENSIKIDLNQNFRCKKNIIDGVNRVFEGVMDDYDEAAQLNPGVVNDEEYDFPVEVILTQEEFEITDAEEFEELKDLKQAEAEAMAVANRINQLINKQTYIFDSKKGERRPLEYRDIVILIRSVKSVGDTFQKVLSKEGIPVYLNNNGGYFETTEITLLINLLTVIDNPYKDLPLISLMYSCVFDFTIDELMEIRKNHPKDSFHSAVEEYRENGPEEQLLSKVERMYAKLDKWSAEAGFMPLDAFVWKLINESGIYLDAGLKHGGIQRQLNLRTFVDKTQVYMGFGENSIFGLLSYFDMVKSNIETGPVSLVSKDEDTVQITTIHKSKGLEYPVVIIPSMSRNFMRGGKEGQIGVNRKTGLGIKTYSGVRGTLSENVITKMTKRLQQKEMREEEIRILYVGMTRAKDILIMVSGIKNYEKYLDSIVAETDCRTYLDCVMKPALSNTDTFRVNVINTDQLSVGTDDERDFSENKKILKELIRKNPGTDGIEEKMNYRYPYTDEFDVKSKYGVTQLNRRNKIIYENEIAEPDFITGISKDTITGVHFGNIYHTVMEHMDFKEAQEMGGEYIKRLIVSLNERGFLTDEEIKILSVETLIRFTESEIGKRASEHKCIKEKQFTMKHTLEEGHDTLVQGVIDCYFEEDGEIVLLDYKTGKNKTASTENYKIQLELYKEALEKATGKKVKEGWLYFFGENRGVRVF